MPSRNLISIVQKWIREWPSWWRSLPLSKKLLPVALIVPYWFLIAGLGAFREDHLLMGLLILGLAYGGKPGNAFLKFLFPVLLTGIIYDSQRFYADLIRGPIHVKEPYFFDKTFFGIRHGDQILTPNEWLQLHLHPVLDLITGFAYLVFVALVLVVAGYFYFWLSRKGTSKCSAQEIQEKVPRFIWSFFFTNMLGYSTYYWYAAAPPWYVAEYGLGPARLDTPASAGGCIRFDQILGTHFFSEMYGRAADVFGAIPSLHVAYPFLCIYYSFKFGAWRGFNIFFYILMCFSAVYLNHHYILDLIWGTAYAILVPVTVDWIAERKNIPFLKGTASNSLAVQD